MNANHFRRRPPHNTNLWGELWTGTMVGLVACLAFAWVLGAGIAALLLAMPVGVGAGGVIGLLVWVETAQLPDDPVLPPARGQERPPGRHH